MSFTLSSTLRPSRSFIATAALAWCCGAALAQAPAPENTPAAPKGLPDQRIEQIRTEDTGARIDEVRVGGQTQSITVAPKANMPKYEIQPTDGARARPTQREGAESATGARVWNLFKF